MVEGPVSRPVVRLGPAALFGFLEALAEPIAEQESQVPPHSKDGVGDTPLTNRGYHRTGEQGWLSSEVHYLRNTVHELGSKLSLEFVDSWLDDVRVSDGVKMYGPMASGMYAEIYHWRVEDIIPGPVLVAVEVPKQGDWVSIRLEGGGCELVGFRGIKMLCDRLSRYRVNCTRLDAAYDGGGITPAGLDAAVERGELVSGCKGGGMFKNRTDGSTTLYIGNHRAKPLNSFVRVYDRRDSGTRLEFEFHPPYSCHAYDALCGCTSDVVFFREAFELGSWMVDFRLPAAAGVDVKVSRRERPQWWSDYVGDIYKTRPRKRPVIPAVAKSAASDFDLQAHVRRLGSSGRILLELARRGCMDLPECSTEELRIVDALMLRTEIPF